MSEVRVFELAKELKMPAKQLLSKMRKAGIPVTGNFSEMSVEQAEIVRKMAKSAKGIVVPKSVKRTTIRQKKPSEKTTEETDLPENRKKVKTSKIVTISTKSKSDEDEVEEAPKRRVRRKRTDSPPSIKEADSESEITSKLESDKIDSSSHGAIIPENSVAKKKEFLKKSNDSDSKFEKYFDKNIIEFPHERTAPPDQTDDLLDEKLSEEKAHTDDSVPTSPENKSKKTKYVFKYTHTEEKEFPAKRKNLRRQDAEIRRRGGGGQRNYYNIRERRPRRQKKAVLKD
ncbi:uncharacterized protein METZ01_LOCUS189918, partial [marine metagenome]